jgi:Leucine-rich repeat (LRR) protein
LNISKNNLEQIVSDEFATMRSLQELILRTNRIDTIEAGGFRGLASLTELDLAENRLKQVRSDVFKDVGRTLRRLVLDANFFRRVPKAALKYCRQVVELRLFDNQVKVLEEYAFGYMGSLIEVYLGGE